MGVEDLRHANEWLGDKAAQLRSVKLLVCLVLGLLMVTPLAMTQLTSHFGLGGGAFGLLTVAAWAFEVWSLLQIGRRARRAEVHLPTSPTAGEAQVALACVYVLLPVAALCGRDWYEKGMLPWWLGAAATSAALVIRLLWVLRETQLPPTVR